MFFSLHLSCLAHLVPVFCLWLIKVVDFFFVRFILVWEQTVKTFFTAFVLIKLHAIITKDVWHLSVDQLQKFHHTKAAKASPSWVYKLMRTISTAAPNKSKSCREREQTEPLNRSLPHRNFAFKSVTIKLAKRWNYSASSFLTNPA